MSSMQVSMEITVQEGDMGKQEGNTDQMVRLGVKTGENK